MVLQMLTNVREVYCRIDANLSKCGLVPYPREKENLGCSDGTCREDDLLLSCDRMSLS